MQPDFSKLRLPQPLMRALGSKWNKNKMAFFNNNIANFLQHVAFLLEISALSLVVYDLKSHRQDRKPKALGIATQGLFTGIPDRSRWFYIGITVAVIAILMEGYQLGCIYFANNT